MTYKELIQKYKTGEVFIYGKSVIKIVDKETRRESDQMITDFIYHTERNRRGIISVTHEDSAS